MTPATTRGEGIRFARALGDASSGPRGRGAPCLYSQGQALVGTTIGDFLAASLWMRMLVPCTATTPYLHAARYPTCMSFFLAIGRSGKCATHGSTRLGALSDDPQLVARSPILAVHRALVSSMRRGAQRGLGSRPSTFVHDLARELGGIRRLRDHPLYRGRRADRSGSPAIGADTAKCAKDRRMALVARDARRRRSGYRLYVGKRVDEHRLAALAVFGSHADHLHRRNQDRRFSTFAMDHDPATCDPPCALASEALLTDHGEPPRRSCGRGIGSAWDAARRVVHVSGPTTDQGKTQ